MPKLTIDGKTFEVESGKRLVLAIEESGVPVGHRCGGNARCTTCRVEFLSGEPDVMTEAEYEKLGQRELLGKVRLSCQIECDRDMSVHVVMTAENQPEWSGDTGPEPEEIVTPEAVWYPFRELRENGE